MEMNLSPDLEGKLSRAAVDYDDWFIREEEGLAQIDAGQVLTQEAVGARLEQKLADHQSHR